MLHVDVKIVETSKDAPNYCRDTCDVRGLVVDQVLIVRKGTANGRPTVYLCMKSTEGDERFVAMLSTALLSQVAGLHKACTVDVLEKMKAVEGIPAYAVRMFLEIEELQEKCSDLDRFISTSAVFADLEQSNPDAASRLRRQYEHMVAYLAVLKERYDALKGGV